MKKVSEQSMRKFILEKGIVTSPDIMEKFGISKPTAIKMLNNIGAIAMGNSVSRSYALLQAVGNIGAEWNLYRVDESANLQKVGILHSTSGGYYLDGNYPSFFGNEFKSKLLQSLPWFLYEHRPQGFVGRNIVYNLNKNFGIPKDLSNWGDAEILEYAVRFGNDLAGSLIVGDQAKDLFLQGKDADLADSERAEKYPIFAIDAVSNRTPRSSAAGEQPKFCTLVQGNSYRNVIVKFSGERTSDINRRWSDLLIAEHTALQILKDNGFSVSKSQLLESNNRTFLEYERIDRIGRYGRRGTSSLAGIDAAFIGIGSGSWANAMSKAQEYFRSEDIDIAERIYNFGLAIGNTDMHFGNLSFYVSQDLPFELAPIYDMLPMYYAPLGDGTLRNEALKSIPPTQESKAMATDFWQRLIENENVSSEFKILAKKNSDTLCGQS